jgi:hypothetical protein
MAAVELNTAKLDLAIRQEEARKMGLVIQVFFGRARQTKDKKLLVVTGSGNSCSLFIIQATYLQAKATSRKTVVKTTRK